MGMRNPIVPLSVLIGLTACSLGPAYADPPNGPSLAQGVPPRRPVPAVVPRMELVDDATQPLPTFAHQGRRFVLGEMCIRDSFEFTSLTDDKGAPGGQAKATSPSGTQRASAPAASGYVDVGSWIDEIAGGSKAGDAALRAAMPPGVMEGNLAALEDEPERASESPAVMAAKAHSSSGPGSAPPSSGRQRPSPTPSAPPLVAAELETRSGGTKIGVVVALLVVVAAGAAAWFTHLIPHP